MIGHAIDADRQEQRLVVSGSGDRKIVPEHASLEPQATPIEAGNQQIDKMNGTNRRIPSMILLSRVYRTLTTTGHSEDVCRPGNAPHIALLLSSKMAPFKVPKLLSVEIGAGELENRFLFGEVHLTCRITNVYVSTIKHLDGEHEPGKSTLLSTAPKGFNKEGELLCRMFDFHFQPTEGFRTTNKSWERDRHDLSLEPGHHNGEDD
ncbi:hypothetical protein D6C87_07751 [Aureobasidium pullulans]|uniref:Uncharacterized protein n=1 Tax=Aureobasidium pullulans TaxID=5580 RepID=A0AB38LPX8_AURPU|nr:hypothetical protein D6C94_08192 [Aureobasidium pullulans]THZ38552.1 hypothetical protein D6C87_07751 [Aureobasidium pullulans]